MAISQRKSLQVKKEERATQQQVQGQYNEGRHGDTKSSVAAHTNGKPRYGGEGSDWPLNVEPLNF